MNNLNTIKTQTYAEIVKKVKEIQPIQNPNPNTNPNTNTNPNSVSIETIVEQKIQNDLTKHILKSDNVIAKKKVLNAYNIDFNNRIKLLLTKLFKYDKKNALVSEKYKTAIKYMYNSILESLNSNNHNMTNLMIELNNIINKHKINKIFDSDDKTNKSHVWVSENLSKIIKEYWEKDIVELNDSNKASNLKIIDIGGGEGNVIKWIGETLDIPNKNLYCIESKSSWSESYNFQNNINYIFWDNQIIDLENNSINIALVMVSMHHMDKLTINNLMLNLKRILKPNALVIIKEHDMTEDYLKIVIDLEHHLYHILMTPNSELTEENINKYLQTFINNYIPKLELDALMINNNFKHINSYDRMFKQLVQHDNLNATNLYWSVYQNKNGTNDIDDQI
jgi:SAM-dependent methyltransferase